MPRESRARQLINLVRGERTPRPPAPGMTSDRYADMRAEPPTLAKLVQRAARSGDLDATLPGLPPAVADALRAIAAGERIPAPLAPEEIAQLGQTVATWGMPFGRWELWQWNPVFAAANLVERLGLPLETAQRIVAILDWPIGFLPEDIPEFAALTTEETAQVMTYLDTEHPKYTKGMRYAAP